MKIEILGMGCAKCSQLYENTRTAVQEAGTEATVLKVDDVGVIANYGVLVIPALVINGEVKSTGSVLSVEEIKKLF